MEKSTNVKSLTALFNTAPAPMEGAEKSPGHPPLNSFQARRAEFAKGNNSAPTTFPKKPASPKPLQVPKSASDEGKPPVVRPGGFSRSVGSIHGASQDSDAKPQFPKPSGFKTFEQPKEEPKVPFPKPIGNKPYLATNSPQENRFGVKPPIPSEPKEDLQKPAFPRPSAVKASENESKPYVQNKPQFGTKFSQNSAGPPSEVNSNKHGLASKTFSNSLENKKQAADHPEQPGPTSQVFPGVTLKPSGIKAVQSKFLQNDEPNDRTKPVTAVRDHQARVNHNGGPSVPSTSKFPRIPSKGQIPAGSENPKEQKNSSEPKLKPLPTLAQLGPPPQKPTRPPNVDIERFRKGKTPGNKVAVSEQKSSALSAALPPPPPVAKSPAGPSIPSLPPRNIRGTNEDHKSEDGAIIDDISEESDEECYQDIDEHSAQYKKEQEEKNEKKRKKELEQAKKEQKEREKKDQETRKRFKLTDKIDVIHQAKANTEYKGGKNELSFKNGDQIEIIRVTDNPEGKWLGRMKGNYGYIKTSMVKVDYDSLPKKKPTSHIPVNVESDQEIYDDVGEQDSASSHSVGANSHFPPPPDDEEDIYDGLEDDSPDSSAPQEEEKSGTTLWGLFKKRKGTEHKKKNVQEKPDHEEDEEELGNSTLESDIYDDVDSSDFPPPPTESSLTVATRDSLVRKSPDLQTLKRMKKEEKEFRKKFKFTGEIRVLSTVQVAATLATKKWGSKDLPLKPGETLSVIQHGHDNTLLCKNTEGKYGYVSGHNIVDNDGDIYDDIGEDCIYDND
ncbi:FYN-binding protein 1 isoform 2-T2 [Anomaloglossus baeobatrachus]|uniref:FYN-binding protein 1 isoform X2 n=1 Tax=Anomaloglossus baeobatrachus TaxID=238106 RepID=UPI003F4F5293